MGAANPKGSCQLPRVANPAGATQTLTVTVPKAHGFAVGDAVRILIDGGKMEKIVEAVLDDNTLVPPGVERAPGQVFCLW